MLWFALSPIELASPTVEFSIRPGSALRSATRQINEAGVPVPDWQFNLLARAYGESERLKAGTYEVSPGVTPLSLLRKITRGEYALAEILFVEGWTFRQMRDAMNAHAGLKHDSAQLSGGEIMAKLGAAEAFPEGMFFPDTYVFAKGSSDIAVLARAYSTMQKQLATAWAGRASDLPLGDPYEALILASIVEKETAVPAERARIAAVFINRLKKGMRIESDPTVVYGLTDGLGPLGRALTRDDLRNDHPYNTYRITGLPPGPICNPGRDSLASVMNPLQTKEIYFVADGSGGHVFARTLDEHNRNVAQWRRFKRSNVNKP